MTLEQPADPAEPQIRRLRTDPGRGRERLPFQAAAPLIEFNDIGGNPK
jgi:hypothetical protein